MVNSMPGSTGNEFCLANFLLTTQLPEEPKHSYLPVLCYTYHMLFLFTCLSGFIFKKIGSDFSQQILRLTLKADFPLPREGIRDTPENSKQTLAKDRKKIMK